MPGLIYRSFLVVVLLSVLVPFFAHAQSALVNINTASKEELKTLNGIGDVKAQAIIDYRIQNGLFQVIDDIKNVSGIGDTTYTNIKDFITVGAISEDDKTDDGNEGVPNETQNNTLSGSSSAKSVWFIDDKTAEFEVDIGGSRLSAVGTPLEFKAKTNFGSSKSSIFEWKFGDGSIKYGPVVNHTYLFPGEYVVVLSVKVFGEVIVNRINVKVISPELFISIANSDRIEITNNSTSEVDLYGRALVSRGEVFSFPKDTIILARQKVSFSSAVSGLSPTSITEVYLMTVGDNPNMSVNGIIKSEESRLKDIAKIENQLSELNKKLASAYQSSDLSRSMVKESVSKPDTESKIEEESVTDYQMALTTTALSGAESISELSWFEKLKKFFLRTK